MTAIAATIGIEMALPRRSGRRAPSPSTPCSGPAPGEPREPAAGAVAWMAACGAPVVAVDVPSGVEADTGRVPGRPSGPPSR